MTPESIASIATNQIVSAMSIHKPDELATLMKPYADQGASFFQELVAMGFDRAVPQTFYNTTEETRFHDKFTVAANVADPGAGNAISFDVSTAYTDNARVYARIGDMVFKAGSGVRGRITNKTESGGVVTLTVTPSVAATNIGALTAGDTFVIYTSSFAEGTGQPEAAMPKTVKYTGYTQIVKETFGATGTEMTNDLWVDVTEDGASIPSYFNLAQIAAEYRQYKKIDGALLFEDESDNLGQVQTTKGLIPTALAADGNLGTTTLNVAGFQAIDAYLRKVYAPDVICGYLARNKYVEFENAMQTLLSNTNIENARRQISDTMYGGNEAFEVLHQYQALMTQGRTFKIMNLRTMDDPTVWNTGVAGEPFQDYAFFIPGTKTTDAEGKHTSYFGVRYKSHAGYDRKLEVWPDGAAGPGAKIGDIDQRLMYYRSDLGFHSLKTQQWATVTG